MLATIALIVLVVILAIATDYYRRDRNRWVGEYGKMMLQASSAETKLDIMEAALRESLAERTRLISKLAGGEE